jgi:hypothetical protein
MTVNFLVGALFGSAVAVFGMGAPVRRLVRAWQDRQARRRDL